MSAHAKVEIESNQDAILCPRRFKNSGIGVTPQMFVEHRMHIVASIAQQGLNLTR